MILLGIYLISVLLCWLTITWLAMTFKIHLRNEGYAKQKIEYNIGARITMYTKLVFVIVCPILNAAFILIMLIRAEDIYNGIKLEYCKEENLVNGNS